MNVEISVTQDDIDGGCGLRGVHVNDGGNCPVWLAVHRALPHIEGLWVTSHHVTQYGTEVVADLPPGARYFIGQFDHGLDVEPFEFQLDVRDRFAPVAVAS